jgi:hypothetical protein
VLDDAALDVLALVVEAAGKVLAESTPIGRLRPTPPCISSVQGNDAALDAKIVAAEAMVVLGVIAGIGQNRAQIHERGGLAHRRREVGRVLTGADAGNRADDYGLHLHPVRPDGQHGRCLCANRKWHLQAAGVEFIPESDLGVRE